MVNSLWYSRAINMKRLYLLHTFSVIALFLYSFTQVDLGLALTRFPWLYNIQRAFQTIGYFNRPLSAALYIFIISLLLISYFLVLSAIKKNIISSKTTWMLIIYTTVILAFSYNAFSHDLFNYIFDAKILTFYGKNPYFYKALDFPGDPMLSFMHWTHRTYPYGPVWLGITIPFSFLGQNVFIITFFLFKILISVSYLGSVYFIEKIMQKINPKYALFSAVFFAFNPLVLVEVLVSAHLDIFMILLALVSMYLVIQNKYLLALFFLILSIGTKYATIFLLPAFLAIVVLQYMKKRIPWSLINASAVLCLSISVIAASRQSGNFQPWYILVLMPFLALLSKGQLLLMVSYVISLGGLLTYLPYLYFGNWDAPVPQILNKLYISCGVFIGLIWLYGYLRNLINKK